MLNRFTAFNRELSFFYLLFGFGILNQSLSFNASAQQLSNNEYIVVAQLNLWYNGPGCYGGFEDYDCEGNSVISITPLQGLYYSRNSGVIKNQIYWAVQYGVDAFSIEWISPRGQPGSWEKNMDDHLLIAPDIHKMRWCIFYDFVLRLGWAGIDISEGINFDNTAIADTFYNDFIHFGTKYFNHPQYLYVDGRPIIYIWSTEGFIGDFDKVLKRTRDSLSAMGYDLFVSGDEITRFGFDPDHASMFDAVTTFTMLIGNTGPFANMDSAAVGVNEVFQEWQDDIKGLKVKDRDEELILQPAWAPQYKDSLFRYHNDMGEGIYVPAESKEQVIHMAEVARSYAKSEGRDAEKIVWLNTFNNWAETTTIEPTIASGPKYPAGNYQFDLLEVVEEVFGAETFWDSTASVSIHQDSFPFSMTLGQNYPNPVNLGTRIDFSLTKRVHTNLSVFNLMGIKMIELLNQEMDSGIYSTYLSADHLPDGIYLYVLRADNFTISRRFIVRK
jgi:hypothetical protein